jgi:putative phosphoribosyl transferase
VRMSEDIAAFADRVDAGRQLGNELASRDYPDPIVLALPRGGVAVGFEIAHRLRAPLDIIVARKLGAPHQPELAIGAVAPGGVAIIDESAYHYLDITEDEVDAAIERETREMSRRQCLYKGDDPPLNVRERAVILADDGLATGLTAEAAIVSIRQQSPAKLILAVPVCAPDTADRVRPMVDDIICLYAPTPFHAVGIWYQDFDQVSDEHVIELLERSRCHSTRMTQHRGPASV